MGTREVKRMSRGQSQARTQSGRRFLERFRGKEKIRSAILIDVDDYKAHDFIIVDDPECSEQILQGSKVSAEEKRSPSSSIITIDDDDDDDDDSDEGAGDVERDVTRRKVSGLASSQSWNPEESDGGDCEFVNEGTFPLNLSKCKRTYSGKKLSRNRFGLYTDSDSSSSESGSSDCEVMEGSSGKIRDQWEIAASRKNMFDHVGNCRSGFEYHASVSGSVTDTPENVEIGKKTEQDSPGCYHSNAGNNDGEDLHTSTTLGDGVKFDPFLNVGHAYFQGSPLCFKNKSWDKAKLSHENIDIENRGKKLAEESSFGDTELQSESDTDVNSGCGLRSKEQNPEGRHFGSTQVDDKQWFQDKEDNVPEQYFWSKTDSRYETCTNDGDVEFQKEEACGSNKRNLDAKQVNLGNFIPRDKDKGLSTSYDGANNGVACSVEKEKSNINSDSGKACFQNKEENIFDEHFWFNSQLFETYFDQDKTGLFNEEVCTSNKRKSDETQPSCDKIVPQNEDGGLSQETSCQRVDYAVACSMEKHKSFPQKPNMCNAQTCHGVEIFLEKIGCEDKEKSPPENTSLSNTDIQNDLIGGKEKYKETDEYKRAMEEEWESRQRELQIQAEEAQRLKKRRRAEAARLFDMERRQKQRLEEMRQTQKKDLETSNLKEKIRVDVMKELEKLELMYSDMASLLRYLGIHVQGGLHPMSHEVHAAYKQAMLKFHPDRASRTDIRQQVEAEEKFKLISRLKEKLLPT